MLFKSLLPCLLCIALVGPATVVAQRITYSEPDRDDVRNMNFDVVGRFGDRYMVYKSTRDLHYLTIMDNDMKQAAKIKLDFIPPSAIDVNFVAYRDFFYIFYQYPRRNVMYFAGARMDATGKKVGEAFTLDTTQLSLAAPRKIYTLVTSEDKQRLAVLKINAKNEKSHVVTASLFDGELRPIYKARMPIGMPERNDFLTEFTIDNLGDIYFIRAAGNTQTENLSNITLLVREPSTETVSETPLELQKVYLDDVRLKFDNVNGHLLITSFFSRTRRGSTDGIYTNVYDRTARKASSSLTVFSDELRNEAKGESGFKSAFNEFFLQHIVMRQDGGFLITSESAYTSTRGGSPISRYDYFNGGGFYGSPYTMYNPFYSYYYPWNRFYGPTQITRYYADNALVLSFGPDSKMEWGNVVHKMQYDDNSDNYLGYGLILASDQIHFLFNQMEKRTQLLTDQSVSADGQLHRNPTLHNLDRGYDFMPRFSKQVSAYQAIIPCQYRGYICFAKVEF